jgi:hypothetical protein
MRNDDELGETDGDSSGSESDASQINSNEIHGYPNF